MPGARRAEGGGRRTISIGLGSAEQSPTPGPPRLGARAFNNTLLVLPARVVSRLLALFSVVIVQNHLHAGGFGIQQQIPVLTSMAAVVIDIGYNVLYVREGARRPAELGRYLVSMTVAKLGLALPALAVLAGLMFAVFFRTPEMVGELILPAFLLMLLTSFANLLRNTLYALQRLVWEAVAIVLESLLLLGLVVAGVETHQGVGYFVWAYVGQWAFACFFFASVIIGGRLVKPVWKFDWALVRHWTVIGLPFAGTALVTTLYFKVDQPIVQLFRGATEYGWYASAYKPFEAILFIPITLVNIVFPVLAVYHRESPARVIPTVEQFYRVLAMIGLPIGAGTAVLASTLPSTHLIYPEAAAPLLILGLGIPVMFVNNAFQAALNATDHQRHFTLVAAIGLAANIVLDLALIPFFGYLGAAAATGLTELALGAAGWYLTRRLLGPVRVPQLTWRPLLAALVMAAAIYPLRGQTGAGILLTVLLGAVVYGLTLFLLRGFRSSDLGPLAGWSSGRR